MVESWITQKQFFFVFSSKYHCSDVGDAAAGDYDCIAVNKYGRNSSRVTLVVRGTAEWLKTCFTFLLSYYFNTCFLIFTAGITLPDKIFRTLCVIAN